MKKSIYALGLFCIVAFASCSSTSSMSSERLLGAAVNAATALTISDTYVAKLSAEAVAHMDQENTVALAGSEYTARLNRLTANVKDVNGTPLNFKVYMTDEVNAFACADGSIRVYSGLMDLMDDDELMAIVGHEIGHVANTDTRDAMRKAYLAQAALGVVGATGETAAALTDSQLGNISLAFLGAQYSQKQEYAADESGLAFCVEHGYDKYAMANSLDKLNKLSGDGQSSLVQKWFSSHPDSSERAKRIRANADALK